MADAEFVDMFFEERYGDYTVYGIGRGGSLVPLGRHRPWFYVYVPRGKVEKALREIRRTPGTVDAEVVEGVIPLIPEGVRHIPRPDYTAVKVYAAYRRYVPSLAVSLSKAISGSYVGEYNIVYAARASFDLGIKYFHRKCPIIFRPNSELESLSIEILGKARKFRIMAFDIEVYAERGRFPPPGSPIISIQYGTVELGDDSFYEPSWPRDNVEVIIAERADPESSEEVVEEFMKALDRARPDMVVGYNSAKFDVVYIQPFARRIKGYALPDPHHMWLWGRVYPHIDLLTARDMMGSSLGVRSQRARALEDVVKELVKRNSKIKWLLESDMMRAEEQMDHTKLADEWAARSRLFYSYITADVYLTLVLAKLWMPTIILLSALVQMPPTLIHRLNTGQVAEYNMVHWLETMGFATVVTERKRKYRKVKSFGKLEEYFPRDYADIKWVFHRGKVYVKRVGYEENVVEGDFSQLYPTMMSNDTLDPTALRAREIISEDNPFRVARFSDPLFSGYRAAEKAFVAVLGDAPSKASDTITAKEIYVVMSTYGPIAYLLYKLFNMRRITKKLKKKAENRPELAAPDQAVKILNNASYGAMSKRRGFISEVLSSYVFWKTLLILYDVISYTEKKLGAEVLYGDTDSIFVKCREDEARVLYPNAPISEACAKWFTERLLPAVNRYVQEKYGEEYEIKFEGSFDFCIYPKLKHGGGAAKKSYICGHYGENGPVVEVFKGDFYKALAPEGVRERLAEFYEAILVRKPRTARDIEELMKDFLRGQPPHKFFVKKSVDSFRTDKQRDTDPGKYLVKLKNLNKPFHYAALHLAMAYGLPGVTVKNVEEIRKGHYAAEFYVDAEKVLSTGGIQVFFIPTSDPKRFYVFVNVDNDGMVVVHKVAVKSVEIVKQREGRDTFRETGYLVRESYVVQREEPEAVLAKSVRAMRKYIIDDVEKKLLPALYKEGFIDKWMRR